MTKQNLTQSIAYMALLGLLWLNGWLGQTYTKTQTNELTLSVPAHSSFINLAFLGEKMAAAYSLLLHVQTIDAGTGIALRKLNYFEVQTLNPNSGYGLLMASRLFAEIADERKPKAEQHAQQQAMLDFVADEFAKSPNIHWPWMSHAVYVARHRMQDQTLALLYARQLRAATTTPPTPHWARQMEVFVLEDMNELDAAKVLLGGLLESGQYQDERDFALMSQRLAEMSRRQQK